MTTTRKIFALLVGAALLSAGSLSAQTIESASELYKKFIGLTQTNEDKSTMYRTLYQSYTEFLQVAAENAVGSIPHVKAKNSLRELYPFLQSGAVYFSQNGGQSEALQFAQAYVDMPLSDLFLGETLPKNNYYTTMVYFAASGSYNAKDYQRAIKYFREYLTTGEQQNRRAIFTYMAKSCLNIGNTNLAKIVLEEAVNNYPTDYNLLSMAINCCIDTDDNTNLKKYVSKALTIKPNDVTLLNIQGKLYEDEFDFQNALSVYTVIRNINPLSMDVAKHLALNYFNLAVTKYNLGLTEEDKVQANTILGESKDYFTEAEVALKDILATDPTSLKYMIALGVTYNCLEKNAELSRLNQKIQTLGGTPVLTSSIPALVAYNSPEPAANEAAIAAAKRQQAQQAQSALFTTPTEQPLFSEYAKKYVEKELVIWQEKDAYETAIEYQKRVTEATREVKVQELLKVAEKDYLMLYAQNIKIDNLELQPYDAENRAFLAISEEYGSVIIPVPRSNKEALVFERNWGAAKFENPSFYIKDDKLTLSALTVVTPTGKSYRYDDSQEMNYTRTDVDIQFDAIDNNFYASGSNRQRNAQVSESTIQLGTSDVDLDIPETTLDNSKTFAVIIANENYQMVGSVPLALNDGETFRTYCEKTLGLPKNNIRFYKDATYGKILTAIRDIKDISSALNGKLEVIFYYAGHGVPDEGTKDAFLLPVDADGQQTDGCYSLKKLYQNLEDLNSENVYVFLDACFSGAKRDGGTLAQASRGVAIKAKPAEPKGNMVIFSAASDDETALPYQEKGHGLFTYYLLKKLKESNGTATLLELGNYIKENVMSQSIIVNRKMQTPTVTFSSTVADYWQGQRLADEPPVVEEETTPPEA